MPLVIDGKPGRGMSNRDPRMDARTNPFSPASDETQAEPRQITGLMVLGFMLAFFAIIVGVNAFMVHAALTTFGGVGLSANSRVLRRIARSR